MSEPQSLVVERLTTSLIPDVMRIHQAGLGYSLNGRLGQEHLASLYQTMADDNHCYVGVAVLDGHPAGVISGTVNGEALKSRLLSSLSVRKATKIALEVATHPALLYEWWEENRIAAPVYDRGQPVKAVLTAIAVDEKFRTRGVGRQLVGALERFFVAHQVRMYRLDTLVTNTAAREFYKRLSFSEVATRANSIVLVRVLEA
jgi:ribosomal protein S18 acetylase RimI-like enzyme